MSCFVCAEMLCWRRYKSIQIRWNQSKAWSQSTDNANNCLRYSLLRLSIDVCIRRRMPVITVNLGIACMKSQLICMQVNQVPQRRSLFLIYYSCKTWLHFVAEEFDIMWRWKTRWRRFEWRKSRVESFLKIASGANDKTNYSITCSNPPEEVPSNTSRAVFMNY